MQQILNELRKLKVPVSGYVVNNEPRCKEEPYYIVAAGLEEILAFPKGQLKDADYHHIFSQAIADVKKRDETIDPIDYKQMMPYTMADGKFELKKLQMINKYKSVDKLSKEDVGQLFLDAHEVGYLLTKEPSMVDQKSEVESILCYIFEEEPSTNTIAMANQFNINHFDILKKLFEMVRRRPSILQHIHWNVCKYEAGKGATTYSLFLELDEFVYQALVRSMGTPKSKEREIFMFMKLEEYYNAFTNMRSDYYMNGGTTQEMANLTDKRKDSTAELFRQIHIFVTDYNHRMNTDLTFDLVKRIVNNLINKHMGINSLEWNKNRYTLDGLRREELNAIETFISNTKKLPKMSPSRYVLGLYNALHAIEILNKEELETRLLEDLKTFKVDHLWNQLKQYA